MSRLISSWSNKHAILCDDREPRYIRKCKGQQYKEILISAEISLGRECSDVRNDTEILNTEVVTRFLLGHPVTVA